MIGRDGGSVLLDLDAHIMWLGLLLGKREEFLVYTVVV